MKALTPSTRWSARAAGLFAGLLVASGAAALSVAPMNPDTAYAMVVARRLLAGDRLYVDMQETNPPLFYCLMSVPALLGRVAHLPDERLVGVFAAGLLLIAALSAIRIVRLEPAPAPLLVVSLVGAFVAAMTIPFMAWAGQREQLTAMLVFPYTLLACRTATGAETPRATRVWCALLASVGFAIKPHFLLAWLAIEGGIALWRGPRSLSRLEPLLIAMTQAVYGVAIILFAREYLTRIVPLALATYWAYGTTIGAIVRELRFMVLAAAGAVTVALPVVLRSQTAAARFASILGAATLGWLVAYAAQSVGWYYQFLPAAVYGAAACAAAGVAVLETVSTASLRAYRRLAAAAFVLAVLFGVGTYLRPRVSSVAREAVRTVRERYAAPLPVMADIIQEHAVGEPIFVLSTSMWPAFPLVNLSGATWPYRYHFLWPLPAFYRDGAPYRSPASQSHLEREFFEAVVTDLVHRPPRLLIVERGRMLQAMEGRTFDFVEYFSASPEFKQLLARYARIGRVDRWEFFERP